LSTVRDADEIIVIRKGEVVERGNHDELLKLGGVYKSLVERQLMAMQLDESWFIQIILSLLRNYFKAYFS